jgi:uncharacterized phiE125 gp8 family phage protein
MRLITVTPPTVEPVSLAEMMTHAALPVVDLGSLTPPYSGDEAMLAAKIVAARQFVENLTGVAMITRTLRVVLDAFSSSYQPLPFPPLVSVGAVSYIDTSRVLRTLAPEAYVVRGAGADGIVAPVAAWPATDTLPGSVEITFTAGYGAEPAAVPEALREAVRLLAGHLLENREAVVTGTGATELPIGLHDLIAPFRRWRFA